MGRDYVYHLKFLRWITQSNTSNSHRKCHWFNKISISVFNNVYNLCQMNMAFHKSHWDGWACDHLPLGRVHPMIVIQYKCLFLLFFCFYVLMLLFFLPSCCKWENALYTYATTALSQVDNFLEETIPHKNIPTILILLDFEWNHIHDQHNRSLIKA